MKHPHRARGAHQKILDLLKSRNLPEAMAACERLCETASRDPEAWLLAAAVFLEAGQPRRALDSCAQAARLKPGLPGEALMRGEALLRLGQFAVAAQAFQSVLAVRPQDPEALRGLAEVALASGAFQDAYGLLVNSVRLQPDSARSRFLLGAVCGQLGLFREAHEHCAAAVQLAPGNADAHYNLAQACMHLGRPEDAVHSYREVVAQHPRHFDALNGLGIALQESGQYEEAIKWIRAALEIRPDFAPTQYLLASLEGGNVPEQAPPEYVRELFDKYAHKFDQHLTQGLEYRTPTLLDRLLRQVLSSGSTAGGGMAVLDLGCGTGLCGPLLRDLAARLVGIDLSPGMIEKAHEKAVYDELAVADAVATLEAAPQTYDLVIAADVFPYIGRVDEVFRACRGALRNDGLFAFSTEADESIDTYVLRPTNRYAHAAAYLRQEAARAGFVEAGFESVVLRKDRGKPVDGYLFVLRPV